jgi:hypothetical protein
MPRKVFYGRSKPIVATEALASLQKRVISLNKVARELLGPIASDDEQRPIKVELSYDDEEHVIGLTRVDTNDLHLYPVRRATGAGDVWVISSAAFTRMFKIPVEGLRRYRVRVEENTEQEGPTLLIDLRDTNEVAKFSRGRSDGQLSTE